MRATAKTQCYLCVWCAEAERANRKKEKKERKKKEKKERRKKEKEEKQTQDACKSKVWPSEAETEAASAAQSLLEHSVSRPLSRAGGSADATGTAGHSLTADPSKASSQSHDTSHQVQLKLCLVTLSLRE